MFYRPTGQGQEKKQNQVFSDMTALVSTDDEKFYR